jgi:trans-aconitate methyltransferase
MADRIAAHQPRSVLDVGVGCGTYATLLRPLLPRAWFIGVEVHEPYVHRFGLRTRYDALYVCDVRDLDPLPDADVVILGDVIEHLPHADAVTLWARARRAARLAVFAALPVVEWPQGEVDGNPHEAHLHTWSHADVLALPGVADWYDPGWPTQTGAYEAKPGRG